MKVAIFGRFYNSTTTQSLETLFHFLNKKEIVAYIESDFYKLINESEPNKINFFKDKQFDILDKSFDLLISVGGDGTILRAITFVKDLGIPIIGINTGRLGFLATIQVNDIESAIQNIIDGKYKISKESIQ